MRRYSATVRLEATLMVDAPTEDYANQLACQKAIEALTSANAFIGANFVLRMTDLGEIPEVVPPTSEEGLNLRAEVGLDAGNTVQSLGPTETTPITPDIPAVKQLKRKV